MSASYVGSPCSPCCCHGSGLPVVGPAHTGINRCYNLGGLTAPAVQQLSLGIILILYPTYSSIRNTNTSHTPRRNKLLSFLIFASFFFTSGQARTGWEELHFEPLFINDSFSILFLPKTSTKRILLFLL